MTEKHKWEKVISSLMILALCTVAIGCGSTTAPTEQPTAQQEEPKAGGTITVAINGELDTLDPHKSKFGIKVEQIGSLFGGSLLYLDPTTKALRPYLAESYTLSEDKRKWTFKIRKGITFHDGSPVTAKSFKETFDRIINPDTGVGAAGVLMDGLKGAEALDDETLILSFDEPTAPGFTYLSAPGIVQPLSIKAIEKAGDQYGRQPVGVGPWKFAEWKTGESMKFVRNDAFQWPEDFYQNKGAVKPDQLILKFIQDTQTLNAALESGTVDIATDLVGKDVKRFVNHPKFEVISDLDSGLSLFLMLNLKDDRFKELSVRKAISMAVNKEVLVKAVLQGEGSVAHSPLSPNIMGYDKESESYDYHYNLEESRKLLDQANWVPNAEGIREKGGKTLSTKLLINPKLALDAQLIQSMMQEIGVKVVIEQLEETAYATARHNGSFDMVLGSYYDPDPDILYTFFDSSQVSNFASVHDPKLEELVRKGRTIFDPEVRMPLYAEAQKLVIDQAYIVPIYVRKHFVVVNKRVKGVKFGNGRLLLNDAWVK
ncbi:ABC transporter substrate-binding protein [uncultured Brevibacillus sp.]|uniref:ABC transporter substrate-binding protein n=1 Tax=uncultured Brevibacillus sp. TaxID=169970 RepID=UPI00259A000E|nr:ABC transporter substrate-binding protein [uncultured Brevibacillus sp.]